MNINEILKALTQAIEDKNLTILTIILIGVLVLFSVNIIFGTIIGAKNDGFNLKKFLFGVFKASVIFFITLLGCYGFNVLCIGMAMAEFIVVDSDTISVIEIITVASLYGLDLFKEVIEKVKSFMQLKYFSYDNVKEIINDYTTDERG